MTKTIKRIEFDGIIELSGIGVRHKVDKYFKDSVHVEVLERVPEIVVGFLISILFTETEDLCLSKS